MLSISVARQWRSRRASSELLQRARDTASSVDHALSALPDLGLGWPDVGRGPGSRPAGVTMLLRAPPVAGRGCLGLGLGSGFGSGSGSGLGSGSGSGSGSGPGLGLAHLSEPLLELGVMCLAPLCLPQRTLLLERLPLLPPPLRRRLVRVRVRVRARERVRVTVRVRVRVRVC